MDIIPLGYSLIIEFPYSRVKIYWGWINVCFFSLLPIRKVMYIFPEISCRLQFPFSQWNDVSSYSHHMWKDALTKGRVFGRL